MKQMLKNAWSSSASNSILRAYCIGFVTFRNVSTLVSEALADVCLLTISAASTFIVCTGSVFKPLSSPSIGLINPSICPSPDFTAPPCEIFSSISPVFLLCAIIGTSWGFCCFFWADWLVDIAWKSEKSLQVVFWEGWSAAESFPFLSGCPFSEEFWISLPVVAKGLLILLSLNCDSFASNESSASSPSRARYLTKTIQIPSNPAN